MNSHSFVCFEGSCSFLCKRYWENQMIAHKAYLVAKWVKHMRFTIRLDIRKHNWLVVHFQKKFSYPKCNYRTTECARDCHLLILTCDADVGPYPFVCYDPDAWKIVAHLKMESILIKQNLLVMKGRNFMHTQSTIMEK